MLTTIGDINEWIDESESESDKTRRKAIHILLYSIASSEKLNVQMAMKGGILMAIKYKSSRHTTDVDFSTKQTPIEFDEQLFFEELNRSLLIASTTLEYGLACFVQSKRKNPNSEKATYPTYQIKIGYVSRLDKKLYNRVKKAGRANTAISIDYSINEVILDTELFSISPETSIYAYSLTDLIAEKYRALLQQIEKRKHRKQDVYDIYYLLNNFKVPDENEKSRILTSLIKKSKERGLNVTFDLISNPIIKGKTKQEYHLLEHEILGELPDFETVFKEVKLFYESLPW